MEPRQTDEIEEKEYDHCSNTSGIAAGYAL